MYKTIFQTYWTRLASSALHLLVVVLTAKILGAEGKGLTSLITTSILIIILFNDLLGGTALVYLSPRHNLLHLLIPSYAWAIVMAAGFGFAIAFLDVLPPEYYWHLALISLLHALSSIHLTLLIGMEKIKENNLFFMLKISSQLLVLVLFFFVMNRQDVMAFVYSLYVANFVIFLLSLYPVWRHVSANNLSGFGHSLRQLIRYGFIAQFANIIQFLNYRFSFYLLNYFFNPAAVGIYSISLAVAEIIWLMSKSIALVQYARIANTTDPAYAIRLTVKLVKISFISVLLFMLPALLLPNSVYAWIFGPEFGEARIALLAMAAGIGCWGLATILTGYFAGRGLYHINTIGSGIGFVVTMAAGIILIPKWSWTGAGLTASLSFLATSAYTIWQFSRTTGVKPIALLPKGKDLLEWKTKLAEWNGESGR